MKVQCEKCKAQYNIDESRVPPEGLQIKCPRCMTTFIVRKQAPDTAGDLFDLSDAAPPPPSAPTMAAPMPSSGGSSLPNLGSSSLPPVGASSLPDIPDEPAISSPRPSPGSEGQIFDFIDHEIGAEEEAAAPSEQVRYRIKRKSGKIFGPFDVEAVKKMLGEHQLMGNEEASVDGRTFKPLGAFEEFAEVIRTLMEEPAVVGIPDMDEAEVVLAPKGVEFAEPPKPKKEKTGPGAGTFLLLGLIVIIVLGGLLLGLTPYGIFGHKLITGPRGGSSTEPSKGPAAGGGQVTNLARKYYYEDTFAGYSSVCRELEEKLKAEDISQDELYLLGLTYAALLRNYGANMVYVERGKKIVAELKEEQPESANTRKADAAFYIVSDAAKAFALLQPLLKEDSRDKEALFLAGWALAYQKKWKEAAAMFDRSIVIDPDYAKAFHALGDLQSLQGDFENAALFYDKAIEKDPRHVNSAVERARIAIEVKQEYELGEERLKLVFGKHFDSLANSEKAKAHHLRAQLLMRRHESEKVVQDLLAAIQLVPSRVSYQAALGHYYLDLGEYAKAASLFDKALGAEPNNIDAMVGKGRAMWQNGDIVKAKMHLDATAKKAPEDPRPLYFLGRISEDLEKPEEALAFYDKAKEIAPNFLLARVAIARLALRQGRLKEALVQLSESSKLNPRSAIVHNGLGEVYFIQKNLSLAESEFREALKLDPELASAHFNLANTLRDTGKLEASLAEYQRVKVISPRYTDLPLEHGYALYKMGRYAEARQMYEEAIRQNPKDDALYVRAGLAAKAMGESEAAKHNFQMATGLNGTNAEAYYQLALLLQEQKKHEEALDLFKQAAAMAKDRTEIHYRMGLSYLATDMTLDATDEFRQVIKLEPSHIGSLIELGRLMTERMQVAEAIQHFLKVVRIDPDRVDVWLALGDAYAQQSLYKQALQAYQKGYKKNPRIKGGAYRMARAYDELGKKKQAINYYLLAVKNDPADAMPHYYLGFCYKAMYKNKLALSAFKSYLRLRADAPDADEIRDEIYYLQHER
ncbi:MAG: zinc-ribbon domain-containing protein [Deltaproteobacteria bacterium]|nr:zinc-ribbon domain-containing protein [Deltaproteobacteria bacterium]